MTLRKILASLALALLAGGTGRAQEAADAYVFTGVANLPGWETRWTISNGRSQPTSLTLFFDSRLPGVCPAEGCGERTLELPGDATLLSDPYGAGVTTAFAILSGSSTVAVRARTFPTEADVSMSFDVPAIRLSSLEATNPSELIFPIRQLEGGRSNLALVNVRPTLTTPGNEPIVVDIAAFGATGSVVRQLSASIEPGQTIYLLRLLDDLGIPEFTGQVRVTKVSGSGLLWGVMYQIDGDGQTSSTPGRFF